MVITVHVTTPFLRPFLFGKKFFPHSCLPPFYKLKLQAVTASITVTASIVQLYS